MVRMTLIARQRDGLPLAEGLDNDKDRDLSSGKSQAKVHPHTSVLLAAARHRPFALTSASPDHDESCIKNACYNIGTSFICTVVSPGTVHLPQDSSVLTSSSCSAANVQEASCAAKLSSGKTVSGIRSVHIPCPDLKRGGLPHTCRTQLPKETSIPIPG